MLEIIGYYIFLFIQIYLISISFWIIKKRLLKSRFIALIVTLLVWCGLNSFAGNIAFYIFGKNFNFQQLLFVYSIEVIGLTFIAFKYWKVNCVNWVYFNIEKYTKITFSIVLCGLFVFIYFNTSELLPYWGNVDEAVHFEMSNAMLQKLFFSLTHNNTLTEMYIGSDYIYWDIRYTYIFGYHFISSVLSKITNIDIIYITHFMRSLMISLFVAVPLLLMRGRYKWIITITYLWLMFSSVYLWFGKIIVLGYSAQVYSISLAFLVVAILESEVRKDKKEQNKVWSWGIVPFLCLLIFNGYMLTGAIIILYGILRGILNKNYIQSIFILATTLFEVIHPYVFKQIIGTIKGNEKIDEAISVSNSLQHPISIIISILCVIAILYFIFNFISKQKNLKYTGTFMAVMSVVYLCIYYLYDNMGYIMHKTWIMFVPILMISIPLMMKSIIEYIPTRHFVIKGIIILISCIIFVLFMAEHKLIHTNIKSEVEEITKARVVLTRDEYICIKYLSSQMNDDSNIEYLGLNGPSIAYTRVLSKKFPYSNILFDSKSDFMFRNDGSFKTFFEAVDKYISLGEFTGEIILLIDHSNITDSEIFDSNNDYFMNVESIFSSGSCEIIRVKANPQKS